MQEQKIAPRHSYALAVCIVCEKPARLLCTLCGTGLCQEHLFKSNTVCVRGRKRHEDAALRLLSERGFVEVDEVVFFPLP